MALSADWREFIELLNANKVDYLIVGAQALAFHRVPRMTGDLDVFIRRTPENAHRIVTLLHEFGFGSLGLTEADFLGENTVIQLGVAPGRIDILTFLTGVEFEDAWSGRVQGDMDGTKVNVIGVQHLLQNKRALGRPQDVVDAKLLEESDADTN